MIKNYVLLFFTLLLSASLMAQNFNFNFGNTGSRVCLVSSKVNTITPSVTILLLDSAQNTLKTTSIYRRAMNGNGSNWVLQVANLPAGTGRWTDFNVALGQTWEYQIKRSNTWNYNSVNYDATGYTCGALLNDQSNYKGQLILVVANNIASALSTKITRLKKELTGEGWFVNQLTVPKASNWNSGDTVVTIKNQITSIYNAAPANDKPKQLFLVGHVPLPRCGSTSVVAPDEHDENKGARGCDAYYADMDGVFTDLATFTPTGLVTPLALNVPGDYKWDQDFFPSNIEMAFGRIDFFGLTDYTSSELFLTEQYLDRLSAYKNVNSGYYMGNKTAFHFGYDNSNDGSYRSLPVISKPDSVYQNITNLPHPQWVQNNGPFMMYMQNVQVPDISQWNTYGMKSTVFSSDQSYWGFGDVPQNGSIYSRIRALLGANSKCLVSLWTTTGINIFHQPGMGENMGQSLQQIMNHNTTNNKLEKAQQDYDTDKWWNRTHFAYYGDPSLRLFQVYRPSNLTIINNNDSAKLIWNKSPDTRLVGYHVYKSSSEFGIYNRMTTSPITNDTTYTDLNYTFGSWYMVRAVIHQKTGSGVFINPSLGIFAQGTIILSTTTSTKPDFNFSVYPNPSQGLFTLHLDNPTEKKYDIKLIDAQGKLVYETKTTKEELYLNLKNKLPSVYLLTISDGVSIKSKRLVVE